MQIGDLVIERDRILEITKTEPDQYTPGALFYYGRQRVVNIYNVDRMKIYSKFTTSKTGKQKLRAQSDIRLTNSWIKPLDNHTLKTVIFNIDKRVAAFNLQREYLDELITDFKHICSRIVNS